MYFSLRRKFAEKLGWHSCRSSLPSRSPPTVSPVVLLFLSSRDRDVQSAVSVAPAARSCTICTAASVALLNAHGLDRVPPGAACRRDATIGSSVQKLHGEQWGPSKSLESDWIELHFLCKNKISIDSSLIVGNSVFYTSWFRCLLLMR
ncbi:hypothetical protein ALC53_08780 [Atta colombica]|uniref:Uncharacterized protein n=1 Tax=Atta colombica TaxID=520822 RepID=A0A195B9B3_9HYME|nr:hypothetical protein ALC53_08780 [Atta colombica]